jgi:hypothetical protein
MAYTVCLARDDSGYFGYCWETSAPPPPVEVLWSQDFETQREALALLDAGNRIAWILNTRGADLAAHAALIASEP